MMKRMMNGWRTVALGWAIGAASMAARAEDLDLDAAAEAVRGACVRVEYTLRYDNGEAPTSVLAFGGFRIAQCIRDKRPAEVAGYLLAPTQVLTEDLGLHPRFIEKIEVRCGEQVVSAKPERYMTKQNGVLLALEEPLKEARPLSFDAKAEGPYGCVWYYESDTQWWLHVSPLERGLVQREDGARFRSAMSGCVIVNRAGVPVGMVRKDKLPADDSWKGSPLDWPALSASEMAAAVEKIEGVVRAGVLPVTLKFRSPKKDEMEGWRHAYREQEIDTEHRAAGLLVDAKTLLVMTKLKPTDTARLERIQVTLADGGTVAAQYGYALRELGCFTAKLEEPLEGALVFDKLDILSLQDELAFEVDFRIYADSHVAYVLRTRINSFERGYKGWVYPEMRRIDWSFSDSAETDKSTYLFRADGSLAAADSVLRTVKEELWSPSEEKLTPIGFIAGLLSDPAANADAGNVPLSAAEENRIAWLGIEMQSLNEDLARANNVSQYSKNGQIGVIVTYVYPGSPADQAGVKAGDILLRLHMEDRPQPVEVGGGEENPFSINFMFEGLDDMPVELLEQMPQPWPAADNNLSKILTQAGLGKKFQAEFFTDGAIVMKEFEIVESPAYYDSAPRFKSEVLGITVRDLTYEVRRYYQKQDGDPGVIVSKVEQGSKASVAGVRPYEIITHLDDQPVGSVAEFEKMLQAAKGELRLNVKRMAQGRIVKIKLPEQAEGHKP